MSDWPDTNVTTPVCLIWSGQFGYFLKSATYFGPGLKLLRNTKMFKIVSIANIIVVVFSVLIIKLNKSKMEVPHHSKLRAHVLPNCQTRFLKKNFWAEKMRLKTQIWISTFNLSWSSKKKLKLINFLNFSTFNFNFFELCTSYSTFYFNFQL